MALRAALVAALFVSLCQAQTYRPGQVQIPIAGPLRSTSPSTAAGRKMVSVLDLDGRVVMWAEVSGTTLTITRQDTDNTSSTITFNAVGGTGTDGVLNSAAYDTSTKVITLGISSSTIPFELDLSGLQNETEVLALIADWAEASDSTTLIPVAKLASSGSDGQVLTRTGSGQAWEDAPSGADGVVDGGSVAGTSLTLTRTLGADVIISGLPSGGGGGTDDQTAVEVDVTTTNFDGNLAAADNDVQAALETIDDLTIGGDQTAAEVTVSVTNFAGNLDSADNNVQAALDAIDNLTIGGLSTVTTGDPVTGVGSVSDPVTIADGAIDDAKISGLAASKLTGEVADANIVSTIARDSELPDPAAPFALATLPANYAKAAPERLGTGTPSAGNFLRGDGSWQIPAGGGQALTTSIAQRTYGAILEVGTTENQWANDTSFTLAHGLSRVPDGHEVYLEFVTAIEGYEVGDRTHWAQLWTTTPWSNATIMGIRTRQNASPLAVVSRSRSAQVDLNRSNFKLVARPWIHDSVAIVGLQGDAGAAGQQGITGAAGAAGAAGAQGTVGLTGGQGPQGNPGTDGIDGDDGIAGAAGMDGTDGTVVTANPDGATTPLTSLGIAGDDFLIQSIVQPDSNGQLRAAAVGDLGRLARDHFNLRIGTRTLIDETDRVVGFSDYAATNYYGTSSGCTQLQGEVNGTTCFSLSNHTWYLKIAQGWTNGGATPEGWLGVYSNLAEARDAVTAIGQIVFAAGGFVVEQVTTFVPPTADYSHHWEPEQERQALLARPVLPDPSTSNVLQFARVNADGDAYETAAVAIADIPEEIYAVPAADVTQVGNAITLANVPTLT